MKKFFIALLIFNFQVSIFNCVRADELLDKVREMASFTPKGIDAPGYYDAKLAAQFNATYEYAKKNIRNTKINRDSLCQALQKAYDDVRAKGFTPMRAGFYYMTNCHDKYIEKFGVPAAMYTDTSAGLMKYKKFAEGQKEFIYKLTPYGDGWFCQNAATGYYIGTGNGSNWYSEDITCTEEAENTQLFTQMEEEGEFFVADDVDRLTSRCLYNATALNETGKIFNWSQTVDAVAENLRGYNHWSLTPVPAETLQALGIDDVIVVPEDSTAHIDAHWMSLGTSITWYNDNVSSAFTKGYQTRVREVLPFKRFTNKGVNGGVLESAIGQVGHADYYTIEHGINDWGHSTPVGTIDDYKNNTQNGTFAANYRRLIDAIYKANPKAMIVLCTPRKGYGFGTYLPAKCDDPLNGIYLKDYADLIREIAAYESLPVADFFNLCGSQKNLAKLSIDTALHPNDLGYQMMADVLVQAMKKVLLHEIINPIKDDDDEEE